MVQKQVQNCYALHKAGFPVHLCHIITIVTKTFNKQKESHRPNIPINYHFVTFLAVFNALWCSLFYFCFPVFCCIFCIVTSSSFCPCCAVLRTLLSCFLLYFALILKCISYSFLSILFTSFTVQCLKLLLACYLLSTH